jgi:F-type H+-transporting ATPase subunit a
MYWLLKASEEAGHAAETATKTEEHGGGAAAHHTPLIVEFVNHYIGEPLYHLQLQTTKKWWDAFFANFGTTAENVFGPYTPETAVPWYTVMFVIACILSVAVVWILKGRLSHDEPGSGQQTLEVGVLSLRNMLVDIVGPHGLKYFPVVGTFAVLVLISNLMGFFPLFMSPTAATSVTFALGLSSFLYYNFIGIKENGLLGHLGHLAGPIWWIAPLIFLIEVVGNTVRPLSLGLRLFGNMFADEAVSANIAGLAAPWTQFIVPVLLMPLALFVAFVQTFVFVLLSMVYISEVSHPPHDHHEEEVSHADDNLIVPA